MNPTLSLIAVLTFVASCDASAAPPSAAAAHVATVAPGSVPQSPRKAGKEPKKSPGKSIPYPLYPELDLASIPWHVGAGGWGPQVLIDAPAQPKTTRRTTVRSQEEFNRAAAVAGTKITVAAGWPGKSVVAITADDVDIVIPEGVAIGAVEVGAWPRETPIARVKISGGGRMGQYRDFSLASDVTIDGVDINGDSSFATNETNQALRVESTRVALLNCRVISGGSTWLGGARQVVIANCNFYHGAASRAQVGFPEGWGIRNTAGPLTIVDSRIQGTRYHNLRPQSVGGQGELFFATRCTFVGAAETRTAWLWNNLGKGPWSGQAAVIEDCDVYAYSAPDCPFTQEISADDVTWSRVRNNRFFSAGKAAFTQKYLDAQAAAGAKGDHDWSKGNTFAPMVSLPAWAGPGDPTQVPLPEGLTLIDGEAPCTSFDADKKQKRSSGKR